VRNALLVGAGIWLVLVLLSFLAHQFSLEATYALGMGLLVCVTGLLIVTVPLRHVHKDASIHASFYGGRCYPEILGTLLKPVDIVDQVAWHSARSYLRASAPSTLLITVLWLLMRPSLAPQVLGFVAAWIPVSTLLVWASSYLAQQFSIYQSQLKDGLVASLSESLVGTLTAAPVLLLFLVGLVALMVGNLWLTLGCFLIYVLYTTMVCRKVAALGIERLPFLRHKMSQVGRRWLGRRNRYVPAWSDNPIVVRERHRDAGRIPGQLPGALLFQFPLAGCMALLLAAGLSEPQYANPEEQSNLGYGLLVTCGAIQWLRAGQRSSTALVAEIESQTMEPMQNTRLHARELVWGWLQVASVPCLLESTLILLLLQGAFNGPISLPASLTFLFLPVLGASQGLVASFARNRQAAARRFSESLAVSVFGWAMVAWIATMFCNGWLVPWATLMLLYCVVITLCAVYGMLRQIEIARE
jgi:hypothetical protein